jgi:hypothetical protein
VTGRLERFLAFSSQVTAYSVFELRGTGLAETYLATVEEVVGRPVLDALLDRYDAAVAATDGSAALADRLRREVFSDPWLGPVGRNVVKMFYLGTWYELPRAWTDAYGAVRKNVTFTVSAAAYTEGLLWPSIGANPPGAKAPGYGSWALPPRIPRSMTTTAARPATQEDSP